MPLPIPGIAWRFHGSVKFIAVFDESINNDDTPGKILDRLVLLLNDVCMMMVLNAGACLCN